MTQPRIFEVTRSFEVGTLITLYEIDLTAQGGGTYYFTNNVFVERVPIKFASHDYVQMPISMEDINVDSQSGPAQPRLAIALAGGPVGALMQSYKDLRGAVIRRKKTFAEFLDLKPNGSGGTMANPSADALAVIGVEMYIVDRKLSSEPAMAEFQLVAPTDQEGVQLPLRIVRKRWCDATYRWYNPATTNFEYEPPVDGGCPYTGTAYFDANDNACVKALDKCSKQGSGCLKRFGSAAALPMQAMPGIRGSQEA